MFRFYKIVHSWFSRITFAAKLSTNLVYNIIFVTDYEWVCLHLHVMRFLWSDIYLICLKRFHLHLAT